MLEEAVGKIERLGVKGALAKKLFKPFRLKGGKGSLAGKFSLKKPN